MKNISTSEDLVMFDKEMDDHDRFNSMTRRTFVLSLLAVISAACAGPTASGSMKRDVAGAGWGTGQPLPATYPGDASYPDITMDASGNAFAVWQQSDGALTHNWAKQYIAGAGWGTTQLIEVHYSGEGPDWNAYSPQIAIDSSGNAIAVWHKFDGARNNIWANQYVAGTGWQTPRRIETDNAGDAMYPQISMDASGNAIVVWQQSNGTMTFIWANRYVAGTGWAAAQLVEANYAGDATYPQIAVNSSGNAVVVWTQSDGTITHIFGNRFN